MNSGIYIIRCKPTGHVYVGSSKRIKDRWIDHQSQLRRGIHHCTKLQEYWDAFGEDEFIHEVVEFSLELEAREAHWMKQFSELLLNSTDITYNPMRNQASVDKMLETRGDTQKGANAPGAKFPEERYLQIVYALGTTTFSPEDLSDYFGLSPRSIRDIIGGKKHQWIAERYPEQFAIMQAWRKNLRIFRAEGKLAPDIDGLPIDTAFVKELHSFRRDYSWNTDAQAALRKLEAVKTTEAKLAREVLERQLGHSKTAWVNLIHTDGTKLTLFSPEDATASGLSPKYLMELKAKKLLRYKGWRLQ